MKKIHLKVLFLLIIILFSSAGIAAGHMGMMFPTSDFGQETLLNSTNTTFGFMAGPLLEGTWIGDGMAFAGGFEAMAIINHSFYIGFTGKGAMVPVTGGTDGIFWGGLMLGYSFLPELLVHPVARITAGAGSIMNMDHNNYYRMNPSGMNFSYPFFAAEAELGAEINVIQWLRITPYAGYRYIQGNVNWDGLTDASLRNFNFGVNIDFGIF